MTDLPKQVLRSLILLLVLSLTATGLLLGTQWGSRWLLAAAEQLSQGRLQVAQVYGHFLDDLELSGIRLTLQGRDSRIGRFYLRWRPSELRHGLLHIETLQITDADLALPPSSDPPTDDEPAADGPAFDADDLPLALRVDTLELQAIRIQPADGAAIELRELTAELLLADGRLKLSQLDLSTADGGLSATAEAEAKTPFPFSAQLDWHWRFPATGPLQGAATLSGDTRAMVLQHRGAGALPLDLELNLADLLGNPRWSGRLQWPEFTPPTELGVTGLQLSAGELQSAGDLDDYQLSLSLAHAGAGLPDMAWQLQARGDAKHLVLEKLHIDLLDGDISGGGRLDWQNELAVRLVLESRQLNLGKLAADLPTDLGAKLALQASQDGARWQLQDLQLELPQTASRLQASGQLTPDPSGNHELRATLDWSGLRWPLQGPLIAASPDGGLALSGRPDAYRGKLSASVQTPQLEQARFQLQASGGRQGLRLEPARAELLDGELAISGDLGWAPEPTADLSLTARELNPAALVAGWPEGARLAGEGAMQYDGKRLTIRQLQLRPSPGDTRLDLSGWAEPAGDPMATPFDLALSWNHAAWPLGSAPAVAESPTGSLQLSGTPNGYQLAGKLSLQGQQIPPGDWTLEARGTPIDLALKGLHGDTLQGSLDLAGDIAWSGEPTWDLQLQAKAINPEVFAQELAGRLDLKAASDGRIDSEGRPQAKLDLTKLNGRLGGYPLAMTGKLAIAGNHYRIDQLTLNSGRNRAGVKGGLNGDALDLDWTLALPEPGILLAGTSGNIEASGHVGGDLRAPAIKARLSGKTLTQDGLELQDLSGKIQLALTPKSPLSIRLQATGLRQDGQTRLDQVSLNGDGRLDEHQLRLDLQAPGDRLQTALDGGFDPAGQTWRGSLAKLDLDTSSAGRWSLEQPAPLVLSAGQTSLGESCLDHAGSDGRLCVSVDRRVRRGSQIEAALTDLPTRQLLPGLHSSLSANLSASLDPAGQLRGKASATVSPGQVEVPAGQGKKRLSHRGGDLRATIDDTGLQAQLLWQPLERGQIDLDLALPGLNHLPPPPDPPIAGSLNADIPSLAALQAFVPQLSNTDGALAADLRIAGRLPLPRVEGALRIKEGRADLDLVGLKLRELALELSADPENAERWRLRGGARSGGGQLSLSGAGDLAGRDVSLDIQGQDFSVVDISHARVALAPDIHLDWNGERLKARGLLHIPLADITPQLELGSRAGGETETTEATPGRPIAPSADVVILTPEGEPEPVAKAPQAAFPIDSRILLTLGERVRVDAVGFRSRIAGKLTLINPPGQADLIPLARGELSLVDGAYRSFGQDLEIDPNSQLLFNGGPITEPELQLRAIRWIRNDDQVNSVGVYVSGELDSPRLELFSDPQLDEQTIHSYLLTGKSPDSEEQMLSVGTRLSDDVYVGYGLNLLEQTHEFNLRYDILRGFALEADVGEADKSVTFSYTLER